MHIYGYRQKQRLVASRNVAFKVAKMRDSIMDDQDELIIRKSECEVLGLEANTKAVLEDVGHNADLYFVYRTSRGQHAKLGTWPAQGFVQRQRTKL